jgi:flagellar hook-associated protein 3 FlgL
MRTAFISTLSLNNTPRLGVARMQADLARLNQEVVTGRMADVGLNLGAVTERSATLHMDIAALSALATGNGAVGTRLQQTQSALDQLRTNANNFLDDLITAKAAPTSNTIVSAARSALAGFISDANASDGHDYLFSGINSAVSPIAGFDDGARAAVDAAFLAKFGVSQSDPAVASISGGAMADFLDNEFAQLFDDPDWGATWSSASDEVISSRIGLNETVDTSLSANEPAMRKLAAVYTMVGYLAVDGLGSDARNAVLDKAIDLLGSAVDGLTDLGAAIGAVQNRVSDATEQLKVQQSTVEQRVNALEGVDPAEAKVRIDMLSTQIQMSYSLTTKLLQMSILNYV